MMGALSGFFTFYAFGIYASSIMYPMLRPDFSDENFIVRKPGETGVEFIGKMLLVVLFWPAPAGVLLYVLLFEHFIPWLTEPKS